MKRNLKSNHCKKCIGTQNTDSQKGQCKWLSGKRQKNKPMQVTTPTKQSKPIKRDKEASQTDTKIAV